MNAPMRMVWTQDEFFAWASAQEARYEFDGFAPELMTGGTINHNLIHQNIHSALRSRLRGGPCRPLGPDAGVVTTGNAVRYPDVLVTCSSLKGTALVVPEVLVVFEVISQDSGRRDRITKMREYGEVASILMYVMAESTSVGLTILHRRRGGMEWSALALTEDDVWVMPELGIEVPVAEFYEGVDFTEADAG